MRIAYCEDEPAQRSRMELLLRTFAERKRLPLTVEAFSDSAAFLFQYPGSYPFDLIFLDIDLGGMDGMALARKIRETDSEVPILFLTNHKEYVFEGYEVQAFRYLLKPVTEDTLFPLLEELQAMRGQEKPHLLLSLGGETPARETQAVITGNVVTAPLPGRIIELKVKVGDAVKAGQEVAVLEAMKMENAITSDFAGTVKQILVRQGQTVATDAVLMEIE